ncbi:hypothetical protein T12_11229 [Trichinella patagoniensis]|uniref:Uncharacterized protein n=1 Tax=Trichinella patagoniensis TaxID=990121 RepID=A0A0V1A757_9BILA|nr:hypothetical protein T12_11229 [Trichinella patagoniensis]
MTFDYTGKWLKKASVSLSRMRYGAKCLRSLRNILIGRSLYMVENNFPTDFANFMAAFITNMMLS